MTDTQPAVSAAELGQWVRERVADYVQRPVADIGSQTLLSDYGMDSIFALSLCAELEDHLGREIDSATLWRNPTVDSIVDTLVGPDGTAR